MASATLEKLRGAWEDDELRASVTYAGGELVFRDGARVAGASQVKLLVRGEEKTYTLAQIWHCLKNVDAAVGDYLRAARDTSVRHVAVSDRDAVVAAVRSFGVEKPAPAAGAGAAGQGAGAGAGADAAPPTTEAATLANVLKNEIVYYDRNAALTVARSMQEVLDIDARSKEVEDRERGKRQRKLTSANVGAPIILVPPTSSAVINLYNVKAFLEEARYLTTEQARQDNPGEGKPQAVNVLRKHPAWGNVRYRIMDTVELLDDTMWPRVVAVFVSGQDWQLRNFKWPDAAQTFAHCQGIYVYFDDMKVPELVKRWNVRLFPIKHQSRNKDSLQVQGIWKAIDEFMYANKQPLVEVLQELAEAKAAATRKAHLDSLQKEEDEPEEDEEGEVAEM